MKSIKYFIQFLIVVIFFIIFKTIGLKYSSYISSKIISLIGPFFRSRNLIKLNIQKAYPNLNHYEIKKITKEMWENYGRIIAEYIFIKEFRTSKLQNNIVMAGYGK